MFWIIIGGIIIAAACLPTIMSNRKEIMTRYWYWRYPLREVKHYHPQRGDFDDTH
jgi:hypothetical protein